MRFLFLMLSTALALGLGGIASAAAQTGSATPSLTTLGYMLSIKATDDGFTVPPRIEAGRYLVTLDNAASLMLEAAFVRLPAGVDAAMFQASFATPALPPWAPQAISIGGPGETDPGGHTQAIVDLTPGQYVVTTNTDSPALTAGFEVMPGEPATPGAAQAPAFDGVVTLHDASIDLPSRVAAGRHVWLVTNRGQQDHQFILTRVPAGTTPAQMREALNRPADATPPSGGLDWQDTASAGGLAEVSPGQTAWAVLDLAPGRYAAYCLDLDPAKNDIPFALEGVMTLFDVAALAPTGTAGPTSTTAVATAPPTATGTTVAAAVAPPTAESSGGETSGGAATTAPPTAAEPPPTEAPTEAPTAVPATAAPTAPPTTTPLATESAPAVDTGA